MWFRRLPERLTFVSSSSGGEIDVVLVESTFFVLPNWGSDRAYGVLCKALGRSGLIGVSQITMHSRESVIVVRAHDQGLIAQTLFYEPEVRRELQYGAGRWAVGEQEVSLALRLIQDRTVRFDPLNYYDRYRDGVQAHVRAGVTGGLATTAEGEDATSLVQALEESLEAASRKSLAAENISPMCSPDRKMTKRKRAV